MTELPPEALFDGRTPSLDVQRLMGDKAFVATLLASLPNVNPASLALQAVVTALGGHSVMLPLEAQDV